MTRTRRRRRSKPEKPSATVHRITQPLFNMPIYNLADEEKVALIHDKSMQILEQAGIAFYDDESQAILREHGVTVKDDIAYFDRDLVMEYIGKAPSQFVHSARNPAHNVTIGDEYMVFAPVVGPPYVIDSENGRRESTYEDLVNFLKLTQMTPYLHCLGSEIVVPMDIPAHLRHLDLLYAHFKYGDKPTMGAYTIGTTAYDSVEMAKIVFGEEFIKHNHVLHGVVNVSSPRRLDDRMLGMLKIYARNNQIIDITPFILSGAMGPVSIAGTVAQLNAEALAGIAFTQMVNPGNPTIYGSFQAVVDLQSGAPVFGAPESQLSLYLSAQMARHYNLPFRGSGAYSSSKVIDAQGAYESVLAMWPGLLARPNFVLHAAGWLENGLVAGYEKFVLDCEMLGMMHTYLRGVDWSDDAWAMESIVNEVPPGGHHLGSSHTMRHYRTAFYRAELFDYDSAEQWQQAGSLHSPQRAYAKVQQRLRDYEAPPLDPAIEEALRDHMTRRRAVIEPEY